MKKQYAFILLVLAGLLGFSVVTEAEQGEVIVTVPFEFVAAGTTLPAGTYTVSRSWEGGVSELIVRSYENRTGMFVLPTQFESSLSSNAKLSFKQVGDTHLLTAIETPDGVYSLPVPGSINMVARTKKYQTTSASGAN